MIKTIIVDDEEKSRITLSNLITKHCPSLIITDVCDSVAGALQSIAKNTPDLVFLDIEMPFENGFTLFEKINNPSFNVIFTTAYGQYAIKAIKYSALDYLLKPVDVDDLKAAVEKCTGKPKSSAARSDEFEMLLSALKLKGKSARIAVPTFEGLQMINANEIVKCVADESYTHITLIDGSKLVVSRILKEFEDLLSDYNFFRVHNSSLINLTQVKKYVKGDGGYVVMSDDETVEVSRRKKNELMQKLTLVHL
ncbi:MAG: LytTR family DNA-binding domain-containing protein [Bacteroidota bacterium]|nr:LytTR family DNA-binding domain-containing protein [Bacteroidota bacterium]